MIKAAPTNSPPTDTLLDEDFAAGVFERVDAQIARRSRMRGAAAGVAAVCLVAVTIVTSLREISPSGGGPGSPPTDATAAMLSDDRIVSSQTEALMFPDAAPLARIDDTYFVSAPANDDILPSYAGENDDD